MADTPVVAIVMGSQSDWPTMKCAADVLSEQLRDAIPDCRVTTHCGGGNMKKQLKRADKTGAQLALILGSDEALNSQVTIKPLRSQQEQVTIALDDLPGTLTTMME